MDTNDPQLRTFHVKPLKGEDIYLKATGWYIMDNAPMIVFLGSDDEEQDDGGSIISRPEGRVAIFPLDSIKFVVDTISRPTVPAKFVGINLRTFHVLYDGETEPEIVRANYFGANADDFVLVTRKLPSGTENVALFSPQGLTAFFDTEYLTFNPDAPTPSSASFTPRVASSTRIESR